MKIVTNELIDEEPFLILDENEIREHGELIYRSQKVWLIFIENLSKLEENFFFDEEVWENGIEEKAW